MKNKQKNLKNKQKNQNEYWIDELLERPENKHEQPDGSILYGSISEPKFGSEAYWDLKKNAWVTLWNAKNPFNSFRSLDKATLRLMHPELYEIFFPFSYLKDHISYIFSADKKLREVGIFGLLSFWHIGDLLILAFVVAIVTGAVLLCENVLVPFLQGLHG